METSTAAALVTEPAPAKINLALHVTGQRRDGYHLLESLVVFTDFGDLVAVRGAANDAFMVDGPFAAGVPTDDANLVIKARDAVRGSTGPGVPAGPVAIRLTKNLPVASGVGGGSSDAAAALRALERHWARRQGLDRLAELAGGLGSDVTMCLHARPLIARGIGHHIERLEGFPSLAMVLVNPGSAVSTPAVFAALSAKSNPPPPSLPAGSFEAICVWLSTTRNDLEAPATTLAPTIGAALAALRSQGAAFARMSGSGATCFGIFETQGAAKNAAAAIGKAEPGWFCVATASTPSPVVPK